LARISALRARIVERYQLQRWFLKRDFKSTFWRMNHGLLRRPVGLLAMTILYRLKAITL
jgi:hypothetical protein